MRGFILTGLIMSLLTACAPSSHSGHPNDSPSIVHGRAVTADNSLSHSVVALVMRSPQGESLCTGSIINDSTILTAGHCLDGQADQVLIVFATSVDRATEDLTRRGVRFVLHPSWKRGSGNRADLGVIKFSGGLPAGFVPVQLGHFSPTPNSLVTLAGYGVRSGVSHAGAGILRQTKTQILTPTTKTELITDDRKQGSCFGDSGGPAFVEGPGGRIQIGVTSRGLNSTCTKASIHTLVGPFLPWINRVKQMNLPNDKG